METKENVKQLELLILGTGTSSQLPSITCLTDPSGNGCACCKSTDKKNYRRNTSAILRIPKGHQNPTGANLSHNDPSPGHGHILIDVGKSFCEAAREHFPKNGIRKLDAVILTHPHADAINGLDDLRAWTLGGAIQDTISIYCNKYTYSEISKAYGYMVDRNAKTGGGDVPDFEWHIIENDVPFEISGVKITPLPVHHGRFFGSSKPGATPEPYICLGYLFDRSICYMADVSKIPNSTWAVIEQVFSVPPSILPILVIDTLRIQPHSSHFGIAQAIHAARKFHATRTYLLGFAHRITHDCWVHCCEAISRGQKPTCQEQLPANPLAVQGIVEDLEWFTQTALRAIEGLAPDPSPSAVWVRPAFDGLWLKTDGRSAWDDGYLDWVSAGRLRSEGLI